MGVAADRVEVEGGTYEFRYELGPDGPVLGAKATGNASEAISFWDRMYLIGGPLVPSDGAVDCTGAAEVDCIGYLRVEMSITGTTTNGGYGELWISDPGINSGTTVRFDGATINTTVTADLPFCLNAPSCFSFPDPFFAYSSFLNIELRAFANGGTADFLSTARMTSVQVLDANRLPLSGGGIASDITYPVTEQPAPMPEPGTLVLVGAGLSLVAAVKRRRQRSARIR